MVVRGVAWLIPICLIGGCNLPRQRSATEPRSVYVWPLDVCPAQSGITEGGKAFLPALGAALLGTAVSALVDIPVAALASAAEADKTGFTATGLNARFFYSVEEQDVGTAADATPDRAPALVPPGCYVVAFAQPVQNRVDWCAHEEFKAALAETCDRGGDVVRALRGREVLQRPLATPAQFLSIPDFYAEIRFDESGYTGIARPELAALYYPRSLLDRDSTKPKSIALTISIRSFLKDDPISGASIAMRIVGVTPGATAAGLHQVQTGWVAVPTIDRRKAPEPLVGERYLPVTISATLHEVGVPSVFLAAFAKGVTGSAADYTRAITAEFIPSRGEQDEANEADYYEKLSAAHKSAANYIAACYKRSSPITPQEAANLESLWSSVRASQIKANVAADTVNETRPFSQLPAGLSRCQ